MWDAQRSPWQTQHGARRAAWGRLAFCVELPQETAGSDVSIKQDSVRPGEPAWGLLRRRSPGTGQPCASLGVSSTPSVWTHPGTLVEGHAPWPLVGGRAAVRGPLS